MSFDYSKIPVGYYDQVLNGPKGMRRFWHFHKFDSVLRYISPKNKFSGKSILDIGCFSGSFLGQLPKEMFSFAVGVDILPEQIQYAQEKYGTEWRRFQTYSVEDELSSLLKTQFDVITLIEVIEHLDEGQIRRLLDQITRLLRPGGELIVTTPNYLSVWPILEFMLEHLSDVKYEEQHLTRFHIFNVNRRIHHLSAGSLRLDRLTTTHFLTPYLAVLDHDTAVRVSTAIPSSKWNNPFGSLILSCWSKSETRVEAEG